MKWVQRVLFGLIGALILPFSCVSAQTTTKPTFSVTGSHLLGSQKTDQYSVKLDPAGVSINTFSFRLVPEGGVLFSDVRTTGSPVSLWVKKPTIDETDGSIVASGVVPGGLSEPFSILTFTVTVDLPPLNEVVTLGKFADTEVRVSDGLGTPIATESVPFSVEIYSSEVDNIPSPIGVSDARPPERFAPKYIQNPTNKEEIFVVFEAQDTETGILQYEVRFGTAGNWIRTEDGSIKLPPSAYGERVYVKAIDRAFNERLETIGPYRSAWWQKYGVWIGVSLVALVCIAIGTYVRRRA